MRIDEFIRWREEQERLKPPKPPRNTYKQVRQYKYLYRQMLDENVIRKAYKKMRKGKTKRREIKKIDANLDDYVEKMRLMIENTKPPEVEVAHPELAYKPIKHKAKIIVENGKERKIYVPTIMEQWLHHIIIAVLQPIIMKTAHPNVCGSFPKRGPHYGKRKIERWRQEKYGVTFFAKTDIRHFYDNIRHYILFRELRIRIKDEWFMYIIELCLSTFKKGLPLGFYLSQWLANYILEPVDWMIDLKYSKYVRYMDDIVFFGENPDKLKDMINDYGALLYKRFRLDLKGNFQVAKFDDGKSSGRTVDFMGFIFFRGHTTMRKNILYKTTKQAKRISDRKKRGEKYCRKQISSMLSYMGWFKHTDSYNYYRYWIKPYVDIGKLKKIVSSMDRRNNHDRMGNNKIRSRARYAR